MLLVIDQLFFGVETDEVVLQISDVSMELILSKVEIPHDGLPFDHRFFIQQLDHLRERECFSNFHFLAPSLRFVF